jgi:hypothetical protein
MTESINPILSKSVRLDAAPTVLEDIAIEFSGD